MPLSVTVELDKNEEIALRLIMVDLGLPPQEVLLRSLRLAGSMRALNALHGVIQPVGEFMDGVAW